LVPKRKGETNLLLGGPIGAKYSKKDGGLRMTWCARKKQTVGKRASGAGGAV